MENMPEVGTKVRILDLELYSNGDDCEFNNKDAVVIAHDESNGVPVAILKVKFGDGSGFCALPKEWFEVVL
jgi:hypothetical protein